ncbi:MAG: VOC family protein [Pseudomonadota bacterium]
MARPVLEAVHPVLPSRDVRRSIRYYVERPGFRLAFADCDASPSYAGVVRDGLELHLQWHDPKEWRAVERPSLRIRVANIDSLFGEYKGQAVFDSATALRDTPWGTREFAFFDPDQNGLTFYRDLA